MSSTLLAECIAFKSKQNGKYVGYMREYKGVNKVLRISEEDTFNPYTRFHAEPSINHSGHYYHIRSYYNNKYWVARQVNKAWYLFVDANKPEEDLSNPSCTLFRVELHDGNNCEIFHAKLNGGGCIVPTTENTLDGCLLVGNENNSTFMFELNSMATALMLPKHVAFKGDNNRYLHVVWGGHHPFLQFSTDDIHKESAGNIIHTNADGTIRIWNKECGKFWRNSICWIWPDTDDSTQSDTLFLPVKFGQFVALKSLLNNKFCKRLTADGWWDNLNAGTGTITREAQLLVEETVGSREISSVEYHLEDARIYDEKVILTVTTTDINKTSTTQKHQIPIEYSYTDQSTWGSSSTWKVGASVTGSIGIPKIGADLSVTIETGYESSKTWGHTYEEVVKTSYIFDKEVPPGKRVVVNVKATKGLCDIPFSYVQEDVLSDGSVVRQRFDDGLYRGATYFSVTRDAIEEAA